MGDISAEPSMEEILSSIKRIIAEEGDGARTTARRPQRTPPSPPTDASADTDEVLELREPIVVPERRAEGAAFPAPSPPPSHPAPQSQRPRAVDPIVSQQAAAASRDSLDALTRLIVKPENFSADNTLEGLVREMLRPMLREWLDAKLPDMVEALVAREIERITGSH